MKERRMDIEPAFQGTQAGIEYRMIKETGKEVSEDIVSLRLIIVPSLVSKTLRSRDRN